MKDSLGRIIYVGKSKRLKKRVQSYFHNSNSHTSKTQKLVANIKDLDYILTDTEFEAFMLECKLIRELKPMYNRKMKNPLAYTYIAIQTNDNLRRIEVTNNPIAYNVQLYFGPYTANKNSVEKALQGIKECFRIACNHPFSAKRGACLNHSLGLCLGMCLGGEAVTQYNHIIDRLIALFDGTDRSLYEEMEQRMLAAAEQYNFEMAAKYRDYMDAINFLLNKEKVIGFIEENRNIVVLESLSDDTIKLFLINQNTILFSEKFSVDYSGIKPLYKKIKATIQCCFKANASSLSNKVSRDEIDEAQIIYSYLQGSSSSYIIIPEEWLESGNHSEVDNAILDLISNFNGE